MKETKEAIKLAREEIKKWTEFLETAEQRLKHCPKCFADLPPKHPLRKKKN